MPAHSLWKCQISTENLKELLLFTCSVMSDSLWPRGLWHARPPSPSPFPEACSNSCPLSLWCHPTISSSVSPFSSRLQRPSIRVFSNELALHIRCPKYWSFSFSISPSNEYSGLISFRRDWFDLLAVQGTIKNLLPNTTAQKHELFSAQLSLRSYSHIHMTTGKP